MSVTINFGASQLKPVRNVTTNSFHVSLVIHHNSSLPNYMYNYITISYISPPQVFVDGVYMHKCYNNKVNHCQLGSSMSLLVGRLMRLERCKVGGS